MQGASRGRKAVFLDVDGTYADEVGQVPDSARRAVAAAREAGHLVFLCTGRSLAALWPELTEPGFDGVVASAGGYVEVHGEVLVHRPMPVPLVADVVDWFDDQGVDFILESMTGLYSPERTHLRLLELSRTVRSGHPSVVDLDQRLEGATPQEWAQAAESLAHFASRLTVRQAGGLLRDDIAKVTFWDSGVPIARIAEHFRGRLHIIPNTIAVFGPESGEMSVPGVHKAAGIAAVLDHVGLTWDDSIGFGDGLNDLEMIAAVGTGVAMANGRAEVIELADQVADPPGDDGIWKQFVKLGLIAG